MTPPRLTAVIDSHQHFYRYDPLEYDWITSEMSAIRRDFLPSHFRHSTEPLGVIGSIAVQARQSLVETKWLLQLAAENDWIRGVVGWVPLVEGDAVAATLASLRASSSKLCGVRHVLQAEPEEFFDRFDFNRGLAAVTRADLTYDLLITEPQLAASLRLVNRHPEQRFIVDHLAKPIVRGAPSAVWRKGMAELASNPLVSCKISGLVTEVPGWNWTPALLRPYVDHVLAVFGPERVLFGSDWPVCLVASEYRRWLELVAACLEPYTPAERAAIWGGNCGRLYAVARNGH